MKIEIVYYIAVLSICIGAMSYSQFAEIRGWKTLKTLDPKNVSSQTSISLVCAVWTLILSFFKFEWYYSIFIVPVGSVCAFFITMIFKSYSQAIWMIGPFVGFAYILDQTFRIVLCIDQHSRWMTMNENIALIFFKINIFNTLAA